MARRGTALLLLGVVAYLAFLIAEAPATLLAKRLPSSVAINQFSGTLWNGTVRQVAVGPVVLKRLDWRLLPSALLRGAMGADLRAVGDELNGRGRVALSLHQLAATRMTVDTPLGPWMQLLDLPLPLGGRLHSDHLSFRLDDSGLQQARGMVTARAVTMQGIGRLGDYRLKLTGADGAIKGTLTTLEGPLQLRGVITVSNGSIVTVNAVARAVARGGTDLNPAVINALRLAGRRQADGSIRLHFRRDFSRSLTHRFAG